MGNPFSKRQQSSGGGDGMIATLQTSSFIKQEQRNIYRLLLLLDVIGCPFMKKIYESDIGQTDPNESLNDRIIRMNGMSMTEFKKIFNKTMKSKMTSDPSMETFDISTWYAVLPYACDGLPLPSDNAWLTPGTLENTLKLIKDFRNELMHSRLSISDADFPRKLEELKNVLVKAAELWKSKFSIDQDKADLLIRSFHTTIDIIRETPLENIDLDSFDKTTVFNSLKSVLKIEGTADLGKVFQKYTQVNPAALMVGQEIPIEVDHIFTPLQIVGEGEEHFRKQRCDATSQSDEVCLDDILEVAHSKKKNMILIEGIAGVGKTTIVKKILSGWMASKTKKEPETRSSITTGSSSLKEPNNSGNSTVNGLNEYDLVIPIQCRDRNHDSLDKVVRALMPTASKTFFGEEQRMMECLFDSPTLFIFDGLDEMTEESEEIFMKVLGEKNKNFTTICTMRPEKINDVYRLISDRASVLHLRIKGVSEQNRKRFILTYCKKLQEFDDTFQDNVNGLLSYLQTTGARMQDHWSLPLNLTLVTLLWGLDRARVCSITCPTELMIQIRELSLVRLKERLRTQVKYPPEELEKKIEVFVTLLSEIALNGIRDSNLLIPPSEILKLEEKCVELNLPSKELLGAFLIQRNSWSPAILVPYYMFSHKSSQEFYAATHLFNKVFQGQTDDETVLSRAYEVLLRESASAATLLEVEELIRKMVKCTVNITDVLSKINKEAINQPSKERYQGTLTFLLGLLHYYKALVTDESAKDIIKLLSETGVTEASHWITILNGVKCNPIVTKTLVDTVDVILDGNVRIEDVDVYAYATILEHKTPHRLEISIKRRPSDIPRTEELFEHLIQAKFPIGTLNLWYMFCHPEPDNSFMDPLNAVFKNCRIEREYMGQVPSEGEHLMKIGDSKGNAFIHVSLVADKDADSFLSHLQRREELRQPIGGLSINIASQVSASMVRSISRGSFGNSLDIFLSDVKEEEEEDDDDGDDDESIGGREGRGRGHRSVGNILKNLHPLPLERSWLGTLFFPRYQGKPLPSPNDGSQGGRKCEGGIKHLLQSLQGVKVLSAVVFPARCRPENPVEEKDLQEECKRILQCKSGIIWGCLPGRTGKVPDMQIWE